MTVKMMNSTVDGRSSNTNNAHDESSHKEGSIKKDSTAEKNYFESIPPFIRSKIEMTVQKAIQQKKIFSLRHSSYRIVKETFLKRGWIQKTGYDEASLPKNSNRPEVLEELYTQSLLRGVPVTILWTRSVPDWNAVDPDTLVNKFPLLNRRDHFCSKIGLNNNLQDAYWFHEDGLSAVKFPRTYNLQNPVEVTSFIDDYVITACISLLKIIIRYKIEPSDCYNLFQVGGKIPLDMIYYSIKKCDDYINFREHGDLDDVETSRTTNPSVDDLMRMYNDYLTDFSSIVEQRESFTIPTAQEMKDLNNACRLILQSLPKFLPQVDSDGYRNLWLVKDSDLSCGRGVWVERKLKDALNRGKIADKNNTSRFIAQKYIERPFLIYNTKFDIRQWFLLTRVDPLQIWMYRKSYLRFSSQPFSLDDTHESVHLCNNSVQRNYIVHPKRNSALPKNNMWDSTTFRKYLRFIGHEDKWTKVIYPGMKASIIASLQVSQEGLIDRPNSFELYGADFIVTEDFSPWLIEINSSPAMHASTSVTRRLCSQCYKDVIKVVVDYKKSQQANTGDFELIYKQCYFYKQVSPHWKSTDIYTHGTQMKLSNNQSQIEPSFIMGALKMKKWKNFALESTEFDEVPRTLLRQQRKSMIEKSLVNKLAIENKTISSRSITRNINNMSNSNVERKNEVSDGKSKKTFLRSSQKIKYISLPRMTTVDRTYFQVIERSVGEDIVERQFEPESDLSLLRMSSNSSLGELEMNFTGTTVVVVADTDNNLQDSKTQNEIKDERSIFDTYNLNTQNQRKSITKKLKLEYGSENGDEHQARFPIIKNDTIFSVVSNKIDIGENVVPERKLMMSHDLQVNLLDEGFNNNTEHYGNRNKDIFSSNFEDEYKNILENILRRSHFETSPPECFIEDSLLHRIPYDNDQEVTDVINNRCLNIYLTMMKDNLDLHAAKNERSFVEVESANNVLNYIFFIKPSNRLEYEIDKDDTPLLKDGMITDFQEYEEEIIIKKRQVQENIGDAGRKQLLENDSSTSLNRRNSQHQEFTMVQRDSNTNLYSNKTIELGNQSLKERSPEKILEEKLPTRKESNQMFPTNRSIISNNRSRMFLVCALLFTLIVAFTGYIVIFHDLSTFEWIYTNIGKL